VTDQNSDQDRADAAARPGGHDDSSGIGAHDYHDGGVEGVAPVAEPQESDGERVNVAVTELLAQVAERTNELQRVRTSLAERTADLQRLQAEYVNYRKRVERDRIAVREIALQNVVTELLPVLDDIGRAREHDELHGGFRRVAESLESAVAKLGLQQFGAKGDPFDPTIHEALMHTVSDEVPEDSCVEILQPGYRLGERVIRPARVTVAEPGSAPKGAEHDEAQGDDPAAD
jgi:molecular chaperone GrpE